MDDDTDILQTLNLIFQKEYEMLTASDGMEALRKVTAYEPDLLILDVMLPKVSGFQICSAVRKLERFTDMPIIFLTAKDDPNTREMGIKLDATYMIKPMDPKILSDKVKELIMQYPKLNTRKRLSFEEIQAIELNPENPKKEQWVD